MTATNNNSNYIVSDEKVIDSLVEELVVAETKTLNERIGENKIDLHNYLKHDGGRGRKTGMALLVNKISNLTIIDVDINKSYNDELKETVRKDILSKLSDKDVIVKTASGGLHIYCNTNFFYAVSNRMIKCYSCNDYDIDIMTSIDDSKRSLVVMADSRVRKNATEPINTYSFIRGSYDSTITRTVNDILNDLNIKVRVEQKNEEIKSIMNENKDVNIDDKLAQSIVDSMRDFEVHNDGGNMNLEKEVTLFTLFQAINSLPNHLINEAYDNVYNFCSLTENAKSNFEKARSRYAYLMTSPFVLVKILKLYQKEYYDEYVLPLLRKPKITFDIKLDDSFLITDIRRKAENHQYKNSSEVIEDLSRVIRFVDCGNKYFIQKDYNIHDKMNQISFVLQSNMKESLKMIKLFNEEGKTITAWDVLLNQLSSLTVKGVCFKSNSPDVFSTFQGYKYNILEKLDYSKIEMFMNFIKEAICDNNDEVYKYLLGWIASMIQHPGIKNETAIILKGLQGTGKNRFTDIISELLAGYSCKNITEISELTGNFNSVVENKMFLVLNELKNVGEDRLANFNALKSIITDNEIRINEKNQPRRTAQNVANFIFVTNNVYPVKIEVGDRRYVVLRVNGKYKGQFDYFKNLMDSCTKEFYDNLLTYFINYDLSSFNVRIIPMTEAKQDLIELSSNPLDVWINTHYDELCAGMTCKNALLCKPSDMKDKNFQMSIKDKCDKKQRRIDGKQTWYYVLKEEMKGLYKQVEPNDNEDSFTDDEIPVNEAL
ncbi:hypothetical protein TVAGG3_0043110 [Trichomonas vaginalis G3]|uniref:hypothetical protein n=2 Tax=Trichomonas vaginalis (strain ATCC PRA-98 / G3) TaxID=412133 RepID=UPI0021E53E23|nr:hypothetical protein TVAGG3_0043110 [Trichomonas vaginalis G3]KAI5540832.1 hypothetical protein TVAGG3_0043110 [Trichomonas vaginalis G3]